MTVTLVSFFNTSNIGDRLISKSLFDKVSGYTQEVIPIDFSGNNDFDIEVKISEPTIENYHEKEVIKQKIINGIDKIGFSSLLSKRALKNTTFRNEKFENAIKNSTALIIGGGNMIFDLAPNTMWSGVFGYYVNLAKKFDIPVFAISLGIGPFNNSFQYQYATDSLALCDYITFRDYKSYDLFKNKQDSYKNVSVVPDPVFFLKKHNKVSTKTTKIGINIIDSRLFSNDMDFEDTMENYASLLNMLIQKTGHDVIIFNTESKDFEACQKVFNLCKYQDKCEIKQVSSIEDLLEIYNRLELVIGTRMHSLITAYSQEIPIVGLYWQEKVEGMFDLIEEKDSLFNLSNLHMEIENIINLIEEKLENSNSKKRKDVYQKLKQMDTINADILSELIG